MNRATEWLKEQLQERPWLVALILPLPILIIALIVKASRRVEQDAIADEAYAEGHQDGFSEAGKRIVARAIDDGRAAAAKKKKKKDDDDQVDDQVEPPVVPAPVKA